MAQSILLSDSDTITESKTKKETKKTPSHAIILYNDDVNTFDHVIDSLVEVCKHQVEQAEQCAYIVHFKGKCEVKLGQFNKLKPMCSELLRRGLSANIE